LSPARGHAARADMTATAATHAATRPKAWLIYAFATTILWGVWGAFTELSPQRGFPETLVYCVWSLTMIPPALYALARSGWRLEHLRLDRRSRRGRRPDGAVLRRDDGARLSDLSADLAVADGDHRHVLSVAARAHQHAGRVRHRAGAARAAAVRYLAAGFERKP